MLHPRDRCVVVLGASPKPTRYSYQAVKALDQAGYRVLPVHPKAERIDRIAVLASLSQIHELVDTLTLYLGEERSRGMIDDILRLRPRRVIFNPGSESAELERHLKDQHIPFEHACTLVLLRTHQF